MSLRTAITTLCGYHRVKFIKSYIRLQKRCFRVQSQRTSANVKNTESQLNLNLITSTWIQRLWEQSVPESDLSVKFITEHVLGKERARVRMRDISL